MQSVGTLVVFCGKMGAGKSTMSKETADERNAVLLSEDEWLAALYPNQISSFDDYLRFSRRLKPLMGAHVQSVLASGANVVMDFPANTAAQRSWFLALASEVGAGHEVVYIKASDELCLKRLERRRSVNPERAAFDTEAVFRYVTGFFEEPDASEGLIVKCVVAQDYSIV